MNIFETVKMRRLLKKRWKLKSELMTLEHVGCNLYDQIVYRGGISAERYIQINNIRGQIQSINKQIADLLEKE